MDVSFSSPCFCHTFSAICASSSDLFYPQRKLQVPTCSGSVLPLDSLRGATAGNSKVPCKRWKTQQRRSRAESEASTVLKPVSTEIQHEEQAEDNAQLYLF